jgi:hypothetical protein
MNDFDPQKPFIGTDGLFYENIVERLQERPVKDWRAGYLKRCKERGYDEKEALNRLREIPKESADVAAYFERTFGEPGAQGSVSARTGGAAIGQAAAHSVHSANQSQVQRGLGSPGHSQTP